MNEARTEGKRLVCGGGEQKNPEMLLWAGDRISGDFYILPIL